MKIKLHLYLWWVASESVETQRKGVVLVVIHNPKIMDTHLPQAFTSEDDTIYNKNENGATFEGFGQQQQQQQDVVGLPSFKFAKFYVTNRNCLPVRMVAYHVCTPDTPYYSMLRSFTTAMLREARARVKLHVGMLCCVLLLFQKCFRISIRPFIVSLPQFLFFRFQFFPVCLSIYLFLSIYIFIYLSLSIYLPHRRRYRKSVQVERLRHTPGSIANHRDGKDKSNAL